MSTCSAEVLEGVGSLLVLAGYKEPTKRTQITEGISVGQVNVWVEFVFRIHIFGRNSRGRIFIFGS